MIRFDDVSKSFAGTTALAHLTRRIEAGATTVLIGPSGCGKSTVLRLITGLEYADSGRIEIGGDELTAATRTRLRHRIGYVIQEGGLFPHLTAAGNAALLVRHLGWTENRVTARLRELSELVRLPYDRLTNYPVQLSGGQRQRVSLMRALMHDPELLLLDEPLGALDPLIRATLQDELRDIFRRLRKTVVLVTHDLAEAAYFADEILLMRAGRIVQTGTLEMFSSAPAEPFVSRFVRAQRATHL
jgi:osmoprotectant transport system ATP-binding protein